MAGGYYKAVDTAARLGMDTVQLFTKNSNQWKGKPLTEEDVKPFRDAVERAGVRLPCAHNSYLINLASPDDVLWQKSLESLVDELQRADALGLVGVVMHPAAQSFHFLRVIYSPSESAGYRQAAAGDFLS